MNSQTIGDYRILSMGCKKDTMDGLAALLQSRSNGNIYLYRDNGSDIPSDDNIKELPPIYKAKVATESARAVLMTLVGDEYVVSTHDHTLTI